MPVFIRNKLETTEINCAERSIQTVITAIISSTKFDQTIPDYSNVADHQSDRCGPAEVITDQEEFPHQRTVNTLYSATSAGEELPGSKRKSPARSYFLCNRMTLPGF